MTISVIIPAYNERDAIAATVAGVRAAVPEAEILVVDDCSTDGTAEAAEAAGARVVRHPYNIGNGAAVKTGIRASRGERLVLLDADGQHDPADIPRLLAEANRHDLVIGARKPGTHASWLRWFANAIYNVLASLITHVTVRDLTSGFRVVDRETVSRYLYLFPNTFSYPTTLTLGYLRSGRTVCFVPVSARRRSGKSKIKPLRDGVRFFIIIVKITTLYSPLMIFVPISAMFFSLGLINYAYTYLTAQRFTNMSALMFVSSVILFMMGLVSEQITQIRYDRMENGG